MKDVHGTVSLKPVRHILIELLFLSNRSLIVYSWEGLWSLVGKSDFTNDWLKFDGGKFVTWRDRKRFLYILPAEFHNNERWTRYSVYRGISKRLWMHTRCNSAAHGTPHATSVILEIISISSVCKLSWFGQEGVLLSALLRIQDVIIWRICWAGATYFVQWIQLMASEKKILRRTSQQLYCVKSPMRQNSGRVVMRFDKDKKNALAIIGKAFGSVHYQTRV